MENKWKQKHDGDSEPQRQHRWNLFLSVTATETFMQQSWDEFYFMQKCNDVPTINARANRDDPPPHNIGYTTRQPTYNQPYNHFKTSLKGKSVLKKKLNNIIKNKNNN